MKKNGINIPAFVVVNHENEITPVMRFILGQDKKYAVRSSFKGEDGKMQSFAGQFETILNVEKKDLEKAVKQVRESVYHKNVADYTDDYTNITTSIIIQEMVDAEYSGVIFTANPQGILNETVIVVGHGLGNNVVEDKINTTVYFYNQDDAKYHFNQQENSPILTKSLLQNLIDLSQKIKNIFGYNMDIEFAIQDNIVYILQARPITTLDESRPLIFDNSNIVESYPGISLPLTQDFVKQIYHDIFYALCMRITQNATVVQNIDSCLKNMTDTINWRIYYQIDNWYTVLKLLPFSSKIIPVWQRMMGVNNLNISSSNVKVPLSAKINIVFSFFKFLLTTPSQMQRLNDNFAEILEQCHDWVDECNNVQELLVVYQQIKTLILKDWDLTLVNDMYTFIYTALAGRKNQSAIANIKNLESMKPVIALQHLIDTARNHGEYSSQYLNEMNQYIEKYGDRCLCELKLETQTYRTNPALLAEYVQAHLRDNVVEVAQSNMHSKNLFVNRAKIGIKNREISRLNRSRIFGLTRKIFLKIGQILVIEDRLLASSDVFYLHLEELSSSNDFKNIVEARKIDEEYMKKTPAYTRMVFSTKKIAPFATATVRLNTDTVLCGTPTSMGCVKGQVLIVEEPTPNIDTTGKILVAKSTDPGWVFLMKNAIGIIAEKGSLLSHTAIIARELKKPAIVNVKDCTQILHNEDWVEVDADNGIVRRINGGIQ